MQHLQETRTRCPYCAATLDVLLDPTDTGENYIEDCQVCCKPITFVVSDLGGGQLGLAVYSENEAF
ncbi:CPXCG motif-containing cysteine-rich protein [Reinekea marina]|uniref:CPXCG motif-containing cysteine-rich protein n=1 Tax=Reinekea marina TaxID=1310421 RepID=A0ABV7WUJ9_9GAMM|nr:CPXCG motif-containing cysteine-rich protein [Reinekea marina]MDN3649675.1 CPXCG motif-containing cysteine-rich protein [Reinekea marina]